MTLRRFEFLVNEVRESSDTKDINSLGVYELLRYFNDGQKLIQKIIFTANPSADIFVKQANYLVAGSSDVAFDLPFDIYAHSSITNVNTTKDNKIAQTLTRVAYREKETLWGYAILDKQFILTTPPQISTVSNVLLNYVYKLQNLSYRLGQVESFNITTGAVTVSGASIIGDTDFTERYENFTIVNSKGIQVSNQLALDSFQGLTFNFTGNLEVDDSKGLAGVSAGDWVVCGENGTSHSNLPEECEPFLMSYVQRRILAKIASTEITNENVFSESERADLEDLFKDTIKDALYPVTSDSYYLGY